MSTWRIIFLLLIFSQGVVAQQYTLRNYKSIDGLPQSQVNMIVEDANGYLWIGTHGGGLARFDGREFKVYTTLDGLLSNIVTFLKIDSDQNLWVVHPRGISKFDGKSFTKFQQPGKPSNIKRIRKIFQYADTLFFISVPGTLGKIHNDSIYYWAKEFEEGKSISYSHLLPSRETMLYLNDSSFVILGNQGKVTFDHKKLFNRLYSIFNYGKETLMLTDIGYFSLDTKSHTFTPRELLIKNSILFYDSLQDVFWTRHGNFLFKEKLSPQGHIVDTVLKEEEVMQILPDSEGNTWLATYGHGMYKYFIQDFNKWSTLNMRSVMAILKEEDGTAWIGTLGRGLYKTSKGKTRKYVDPLEPYRNSIHCIKKAPDGTIWVGSHYGLGKYNKATDSFEWYTSNEGLSASSISSVEFDDRGNLWIGTFSGGINFFDGKTFKAYTLKQGLESPNVLAAYFSKKHDAYFYGSEFGLSRVENGAVMHEPLPEIENTSVFSVNPFRDSLLLIGTGGAGVVVYDPTTSVKRRISSKEGLASDFIYFVAADPQGDIWIGTEKGITQIRLNNKLEIIRNLQYDHENGLEGVEANQNAFHLGTREKIFGMIDGLYEFNDIGNQLKYSFPLHLTEVSLLYGQNSITKYAKSLGGFFKIPLGLSLPPDENHITFTFNRVDKRYPKSVKFKYRLVDYDKTWSLPSHQHEVTYSNLPSGEYTLEVLATDNRGSWATIPSTYSFVINTPFYKTAGFIGILLILLIGGILLFFYVRMRYKVNRVMELQRIRTHEQEMLRKEIARDFHDEMGNQLSRIINYVSLLRLNGKTGMSQFDLFAKVEGSAKYLYSGTRDFIWSIDPVNDELSKLFIHLRDFGEKLFEEKSINFRAYNEVREKVKLPYGFSRQANLIFKEAMTNAFKYSEAQNVKLVLRGSGDRYELIFEDDGVGFVLDKVKSANGLQNIQDRAVRINGNLRISTEKSELTGEKRTGTSISLEFKSTQPIKHDITI